MSLNDNSIKWRQLLKFIELIPLVGENLINVKQLKSFFEKIIELLVLIILNIRKLGSKHKLWLTICGIFLFPTRISSMMMNNSQAAQFRPNKFAVQDVETVSFSYSGAYQTFNVPDNVYQLHVTLRGAMGSPCGGFGGSGGIVMSSIAVSPGQDLYVYVGGSGDNGGYNGGGISTTGCNGGGATDIRTNITDLQSRIVVAGGGGGGSGCNARGGKAGYTYASSGSNGCAGVSRGYGAGGSYGGSYYSSDNLCTVSNKGTLGQGGPSCIVNGEFAGAGGGGYYGGGGRRRRWLWIQSVLGGVV